MYLERLAVRINAVHQDIVVIFLVMIIAKNPYIMLAAHHEPMYWSCHKGIAVAIGMAHFFHDSMYIHMLLS